MAVMSRSIGHLASIAMLCSMAAHGWAADHSRHGKKADAGRTRAELNASAAYAADGALWAAYKEGAHVMARRSTDDGKTWAAPQPINAVGEGIGADGDARPKIATGPNGEIYATWTMPLAKPYTGNIRFARSIDGGKTFIAPVTVHTDRQEITHRFDAIAVNRQGQVFVAWIDKRDGVVAVQTKDAPYRGAAVYFAVSDDRGVSFRGDYKLADHSCECCRLALLPRDDGRVLALWRHVFEPNIRDHAMAHMNADGSMTPLRRATYDNWTIDACPHHGPSLAADGNGGLHAVWFTQSAERSGVFYGR
ncbi:MAG: exo-alpha-sialidase [Betaproteobacteria bacterium]|nr:exo-alpha-sialidase [Betaproteobacteria bacterium]